MVAQTLLSKSIPVYCLCAFSDRFGSVIVSSGIMALVDDSIKSHFHSKESTQIHIPLSRNASFKLNMDYVGPKRLIDEVFHRTTRGSTSPRAATPLRRTSVEV